MHAEHPLDAGQCLDIGRAAVINCDQPHDAEVISVGKLTATAMPDESAGTTMTVPICRERLAEYLGGPDADATNLIAMPLWPDDKQWASGERWLLCTVAEVGAEENPLSRIGSLQGALMSLDKFRFQTCSVSSPSREPRIRRGPCDAAHLGEAIPGVISIGPRGSAMPSTEAINKLAQQRCPAVLATYLRGQNQEVLPAWRIPNSESWARGYTNIVCYAEAVRPVRVRLRNLGNSALPS
jgi:hypothetical protein